MLQHITYVYVFQENEPPKNIIDISIPKSDTSIALPYDAIVDELGNNLKPAKGVGTKGHSAKRLEGIN